jgi:hypothetical protein
MNLRQRFCIRAISTRLIHACHVLVINSSEFAPYRSFAAFADNVSVGSLYPHSIHKLGWMLLPQRRVCFCVPFELMLWRLITYSTFTMAAPFNYEAGDAKFLPQELAADMDTVGGMILKLQ